MSTSPRPGPNSPDSRSAKEKVRSHGFSLSVVVVVVAAVVVVVIVVVVVVVVVLIAQFYEMSCP